MTTMPMHAYTKLLVKANLLEKKFEQNQEDLENQIKENTKIKSLKDKIKERKGIIWYQNIHQNENEENISCQEIENIIEKDLVNNFHKFDDIIKNVLENKFQENATLVESRVTKLVNNNKTYAESVNNKTYAESVNNKTYAESVNNKTYAESVNNKTYAESVKNKTYAESVNNKTYLNL